MPRSSRHKSHKQKHGCFRGSREHSDSEELLIERKRKEDPAAIRVSDSAEKRGPQKEKDLPLDHSSASKKRRKDRAPASDSAASDGWGDGRCGGGGEERLRVDVLVPEKEAEAESGGESFGWGSEKRQRVATEESKSSRSSRKQESCTGKKDESEDLAKGGSGWVDLRRIKSDKDSGGGGGRKEGNEHKDEMEKEEKGLRSIEDRKVQDARRERKSVDNVMGMTGGGTEMSRMQGIQTTTTTTAGSEEERLVKQETKSSGLVGASAPKPLYLGPPRAALKGMLTSSHQCPIAMLAASFISLLDIADLMLGCSPRVVLGGK